MSTPNQLNTVKRGEFMSKLQSNFQLLRAKNILAILDGDVEFGEIQNTSSRGNIKGTAE